MKRGPQRRCIQPLPHPGRTEAGVRLHVRSYPTPAIRKEVDADIPGIRSVVGAAFGGPAEAVLVDKLRRAGALTLSAVAVVDNRVVGHVGFSPVVIDERHPALALAPMSVAPDCQRQGIGLALIRWSLEECRRLQHGLVIVVGNPAYYPRFGFMPAAPFGLQCPFEVSPEAFMLLELWPGAASGCGGMVRYRPEFEGF